MSKKKKKDLSSMNNLALVIVVSLLVGVGIGYAVAYDGGDSNSHDDGDSHMHDGDEGHSHSSTFEVNEEEAPTVSFFAEEDAKSGWNVTILTENFTFAPEKVNGQNVVGEGHAHFYVDGEKIGRLYGPNFHYGESFDGTKEFRVTLNANDHSDYAVDGSVIEAIQTVTHDHSIH